MLQVLLFIPLMPVITPYLMFLFLKQIFYNGKFHRSVERLATSADTSVEEMQELINKHAKYQYFSFRSW